ncbi:unnamed protein product [Echinostoma caproni]|uniref:J domain-containing protein n=1 Tax=Echinostoma caproni TaxID=27848 RepID=A0A3P8HR91_9TREM|nr:unnamed protein product [Echinostoma caproni]
MSEVAASLMLRYAVRIVYGQNEKRFDQLTGSRGIYGPADTSRLFSNPMGQAHGSWSDFASNTSSAAPGPGSGGTPSHGARPHVRKDAFSDLLNDFGESTSWQANADGSGQTKSINQMRREQLAKTTDPDQLKVQDWAEGKSRNVRALLCSLPAILWDGVRWKPVSIADLISAEQVKRQYRNAARAIHPDKWRNTENEKLARMIFVELNDAMTEFEKDPGSVMSF